MHLSLKQHLLGMCECENAFMTQSRLFKKTLTDNIKANSTSLHQHQPTSSDLTHGCDGRIIRRDTTEGFRLHGGISRDSEHKSKQTLVPAEGLLGQLAAWQRCGQRQMELDRGGDGRIQCIV